MKKALLLCTIAMSGYFVHGQDIVAATGLTKGKIEFQDFRKLDFNYLNAGQIMLTKSDQIKFENLTADISKTCGCSKYIAAMTAFEDGTVFYIPMVGNKVSIINPTSKTGTLVDIPNAIVDSKNQGTYYARMTNGSDGFAYALNNNGTELLKISQSGNVQNLGSVKGIAEQAKALGDEKLVFGGDMIADAFGNLYVISAAGHVFKLNPNNLQSDYLGAIKGLPAGYTVNGAAVEKDGTIVLGTTSTHGFYTLDINSLETKFKSNYDFPIYDLSSPYFLRQADMNAIAEASSNYSLYPTIVKNSELNIVSKSTENAKLFVTVWNIHNKQIYSNTMTINAIGDFKVNLNGSLQPGIYILKAKNQDGNEVINTKFTLVK